MAGVSLALSAPRAAAQRWNDERALTLVGQATQRRAQQLADSGLVDYQATAHGYLTFLAQLGEGFRDPPQVVKADELALQVYWRTPNLSKQIIVGRRDTTLLPTDIQYHRDHLGIVQNNFPAIIRLGDGDEVQDVPHPLSASGLREYDFALSDSLRISIPGRVISVYEVKVRPRNDHLPRVIGALYLDRDNAQVVRMAFSFTRAAFLDKQLEDLFIVLENGLVGTRFWLPRRQEIEIRRTATWLDYPVRGIIRGRWEISDYQLNTGIPAAQFAGPEIVQYPPSMARDYRWPTARILDSLPPDVRAVTADEIRRVQTEVRSLVREQALRRARASTLAAQGISDFVRFNRVEGTALGAGIGTQLGGGFAIGARGRFGLQDNEWKGRATMGWQSGSGQSVELVAARDFQDTGIVQERSLLVNSISAQEAGSDYTDPWRADVVGLSYARGSRARWSLSATHERHTPVSLHAAPVTGAFDATIPADTLDAVRAGVGIERPTSLWLGGTELRLRGGLSVLRILSVARSSDMSKGTVGRISLDAEIERPFGRARFISRSFAAGVSGSSRIPIQELVFMGGPTTAPGYGYHELLGRAALSQRLEIRIPAPFPSLSLGRFGRSPASITFAPFVSAAATLRPDSLPAAALTLPRGPSAVYPSVGVGALLFFDVIRVDVARGLRTAEGSGRWSFYVDVARMFWSVL